MFILNSVLVATHGAAVLSNLNSGAWKMHCKIKFDFLPAMKRIQR